MIQDFLRQKEGIPQGAPQQGPDQGQEGPLLMVHLSHAEAIWLDIIQRTPKGHFDKETGLRSYAPFGMLLQDPAFRAQGEQHFAMARSKQENVEQASNNLSNAGANLAMNQKFIPAPADSMPEIQQLAMQGKKNDDLIVLMPQNMIDFLAKEKGSLTINPKTGFPQFFFGFVLPILGSALGGWAAGTAASTGMLLASHALGGALGGFAGAHLDGNSKNAGKAALFGGLGGLMHGGINHWMGTGANAASAAGNAAAEGTKAGALKAATAAASGVTTGAAPAVAQGAAEAAAKSFDWSSLAGPLALGSIPLLAMGGKKDDAAIKKEYARREAEEARKRESIRQMNEQMLSDRLDPATYEGFQMRQPNPNLDYEDPEFYRGGRGHQWFAQYKDGGTVKSPVRYLRAQKGGSIDGHEKGQEDNVYTTVPAGTFILDASVVSDVGDGNTKAGRRVWNKFISQYTKNAPAVKTHPVKVALSAGEMMFPVNGVANLGGGSIEKGGHMMDQMVARIRKQKASNGHQLPPAALPLHQYLRGIK